MITTTTITRIQTQENREVSLWKRIKTYPRFQKLRRRYSRLHKDLNQLQPHLKALIVTFLSIAIYIIVRNVWFVSFEEFTERVHIKLLVNEPLCKIVNLEPPLRNKVKLSFQENPLSCPFKACDAYTKVVTLNESQALIKLTDRAKECEDLTTCCAIVHSIPRKANEEIRYPIDGCYPLKDSTDIQPSVYTDVLETQCHDLCDNRRITDFHPLLPMTPKVEQKMRVWTQQQRKNLPFKSPKDLIPSVIFIVVDRVSRNQAEQYLPATLETLRTGEWGRFHDFKGYSMVDETVEGNFRSALTGFNTTGLSNKCSFAHYGYFDGCPWIWKQFRNLDYLTAYLDESYLKSPSPHFTSSIPSPAFMGDFVAQPTDFFVPASFIQDKMQWNQMDGELFNPYASTSPTEFLLAHASTFYKKFSSFPYFSTVRLSPDTPTSLRKIDTTLASLFKTISQFSQNSLVIFASHTGVKDSFSDVSLFDEKAYQHQRPFLYISTPKSMAEFEHNLLINVNRLTTVLDVHETFRDIILNTCQLLGSTLDECVSQFEGQNHHENQNQYQYQRQQPSPTDQNTRIKKQKNKEKLLGTSLLQPISSTRQCGTSGIPESICPCVNSPTTSATTTKLLDKIYDLSTSFS